MDTAERLIVVGLGYVGLPLALRAVQAGFDVVGVDLSTERIARLHDANSYVEDISDGEVKEALNSGRFTVTTEVADAAWFDVAVIAVPTPLRDRSPDLSYVSAAANGLGMLLRPGACVVLESTTYPGTTDELLVPLLEEASGLVAGADFHVGFSPERIDPGNPVWTFTSTPKIVSGIDAPSLERVERFYSRLVDHVVPVRGTREAELAKLLENTFRHVNIALVNELAVFAHGMGIDIWNVIDAASTKPFGFMPFRPGPGVGGHCLPIDPSYLSWQVQRRLGLTCRFVHLANDVNDHMPDYVVHRIVLALNELQQSVKGARLLLLGIAYKKNSGDYRESPATRIAQLLVDLGADVRMADPIVDSCVQVPGTRVEAIDEEIEAADLVIVLTDHDAFDWIRIDRTAPHVFDTRHRLTGAHVAHL